MTKTATEPTLPVAAIGPDTYISETTCQAVAQSVNNALETWAPVYLDYGDRERGYDNSTPTMLDAKLFMGSKTGELLVAGVFNVNGTGASGTATITIGGQTVVFTINGANDDTLQRGTIGSYTVDSDGFSDVSFVHNGLGGSGSMSIHALWVVARPVEDFVTVPTPSG